jgi:hypothetical protein
MAAAPASTVTGAWGPYSSRDQWLARNSGYLARSANFVR